MDRFAHGPLEPYPVRHESAHETPREPADHRPPEPLDPRVARARHRTRQGEAPGTLYLRQLGREELSWLRAMTGSIARAYHVDADDLLQQLVLDLWDDEAVDSSRQGFRAWMNKRARWRAADMLRASRPDRAVPVPPEDLAELGDREAPDFVDLPVHEWSAERFQEMGLSGNEARLIALLCWGVLHRSMREVAEELGRPYAATRQDKARGLHKIKTMFGLLPDEEAVLVAVREYRSTTAAAVRLEMAIDDLRRLLASAEDKIESILGSGSAGNGRRTAPSRARTRGDSDVL